MKYYIYGRGILAKRIKTRLENYSEFNCPTANLNDADVVYLASNEEAVQKWFEENQRSRFEKLCFDFSGYSKNKGLSDSLGIDVILNKKRMIRKGIVSLPGCYASSVLIPIIYLKERYNIVYEAIYASSIGGRSTLGFSKNLGSRSVRFSSDLSRNRHVNEISSCLGINRNLIDLSLVVADVDDGILTRILLKRGTVEFPAVVSFGFEGWEKENEEVFRIGKQSKKGKSCIFNFSETPNGIEIRSYIHNLDFPILVSQLYQSLVYNDERVV